MREPARPEEFLKQWGLSFVRSITQTPTSDLYLVARGDESFVLKILSDMGVEDEKGSAPALALYDGKGAVRLIEHEARALLLEYADGDDLTMMAAQGKDDEASFIIADVLNELHQAPVANISQDIVTLQERMRSLFVKAEADAKKQVPSLYIDAGLIAAELLAEGSEACLLHGDMHHGNVLNSKRGWLAIDPKGIVGDRAFDVANVLCNPQRVEIVLNAGRLERQTHILAERMGLDVQRILMHTYVYACLSALWSIEDHEDPSLAFAVGNAVRPLI